MANVRFLKGTGTLPTATTEGTLYFETSTGTIILDTTAAANGRKTFSNWAETAKLSNANTFTGVNNFTQTIQGDISGSAHDAIYADITTAANVSSISNTLVRYNDINGTFANTDNYDLLYHKVIISNETTTAPALSFERTINTNIAPYSIAIGKTSLITSEEGQGTTLEGAQATGQYSIALGPGTIANGKHTIALGQNTFIQGDYTSSTSAEELLENIMPTCEYYNTEDAQENGLITPAEWRLEYSVICTTNQIFNKYSDIFEESISISIENLANYILKVSVNDQIYIKKIIKGYYNSDFGFIYVLDSQLENISTGTITPDDNRLYLYSSLIKGNYNLNRGQKNLIDGNNNITIGQNNIVTGDYIFVVGKNNIINKNNHFAFGEGLKAVSELPFSTTNNNTVIIGKFNENFNGKISPYFIIGGGTDENTRLNLLTVDSEMGLTLNANLSVLNHTAVINGALKATTAQIDTFIIKIGNDYYQLTPAIDVTSNVITFTGTKISD